MRDNKHVKGKTNDSFEPSEYTRRREEFLNGTLSSEEMEELWIDWLEDPAALENVRTEANVQDLVRKSGKLRMVRGRGADTRAIGQSTGRWKSWMAAAAVLLVAWMGYQWTGADRTDSVSPLAQIELEVYRSAEPVDEDSTVREAMMLASQGQHQEAIQLIDQALLNVQDAQERARLTLNAGSILYNLSRYEEASERFVQILAMELDDQMVQERALWYLGNAYFQMNDLARAREAFQQTLEMNGSYRRVAERYLKALSA
ncbi:MAG: tetratricopeptide repeat protein [Balneolaceae bacterium]